MLSIIDLLKDNTLNERMAGFLLYMMLNNLSFLTAANPSGTGKTTLMGSLLNLLKPGVEIRTIKNKRDLEIKDESPEERYLIHEIGDGPYYSYLWGKEIDKFLKLGDKATIASCIHADTLKELKDIFLEPPLSVKNKNLLNLDLILFMTMKGGFYSRKRRVSRVYGSLKNEFILLYEWNSEKDGFYEINVEKYLSYLANRLEISLSKVNDNLLSAEEIISELKKYEITKLEDVRDKILKFWKAEIR